MKSLLKLLLGIVEIIIIIFSVVMVSMIFMRNQYGYTQYGDNTLVTINKINLNELSQFKEGNLVVIENVLYNDINVGDELYYYDTINDEYIIKTGIVKTKSGDNRTALYTFEGAEKVSIASERILGKHKKTYASYGKAIDFLTSTVGFLLCVILPILVLFIYQVYHLIMVLKYDKD